jgi:hypothetical protein
MATARLIQVTVGGAATPIATATTPFNQMIVQNSSSTTACNLGDATVTAAKGIVLPITTVVLPPVTIGPFSGMQGDASQYFLFGSGAVINILLT